MRFACLSLPRNGLDQTNLINMSTSQLNDTKPNDTQSQLQSIISENPLLQEKRFRFDANAGTVTMRGTVKSWYEKQMAQEALRNIDGIVQIENELTVEAV